MVLSDYVQDMKKMLFTTSKEELNNTLRENQKKEPDPLNRMFPDRLDKENAISRQTERRLKEKLIIELCPSSNFVHHTFCTHNFADSKS